jgi:hypothetical protein
MRPVLAGRARLGLVLVTNGADHHAPQERWAEAVDALARAAAPEPVGPTSLAGFARLAAERAAALEARRRRCRGWRASCATRTATRGRCRARSPRAPRRSAARRTPRAGWCATWSPGRRSPRSAPATRARPTAAGAPARRLAPAPRVPAARHALRLLDRRGGPRRRRRLDDCAAQARGLRADALAALVGHDADTARRWRDGWRPAAVVRNRAARARGGVAEIELLTFVRDVPVGRAPPARGATRAARAGGAFR